LEVLLSIQHLAANAMSAGAFVGIAAEDEYRLSTASLREHLGTDYRFKTFQLFKIIWIQKAGNIEN
jgi:hypothetical protein